MNLSGHTRKSYDQQLARLQELIVEMGGHVRTLVQATKQGLRERDVALAAQAKQQDKEINRLEGELEEAATNLLALQQPMAVDLRFVTSALKISGVLERAGDLAKNIVKRSTRLGDYFSTETFGKLEAMADIIVDMLDEALDAVQQRDAAKAVAVWKRDDEVDDLYRDIFATMQREMLAGGEHVAACTHIAFMAKNFERLADYVTNLAKTVHYIATGEPASKALLKD